MTRFAVCLLAVLAAQGQENPFSSDPSAAEVGRGMYRIYCSACHGIRAQGGRGPDLTRGTFRVGDTDSALFKVIAEGSAGTEMNGYLGQGPENVWRFVSYVRSLAPKEPERFSGDAAAGERVFWGKGACGGCHRMGRRGSRMGPDLTMTGRSRSLKYLRESIVEPDNDLTRGYGTVRVRTHDGRTIVGVERGYDAFSATLMDSSETFHSFLREEVESLVREDRSLMPRDYAKRLSEKEVEDLVAYMVDFSLKERR
ncbi:MAG: c-type cytochrome [Bryobacterales bacterium]|nr:c-type cytochrome [Bryobacterales bacterium]